MWSNFLKRILSIMASVILLRNKSKLIDLVVICRTGLILFIVNPTYLDNFPHVGSACVMSRLQLILECSLSVPQLGCCRTL